MRLEVWLVAGFCLVGLSGCSGESPWLKTRQVDENATVLPDGTVRPVARPGDLQMQTPGAGAVQQQGVLGVTIVSLGTPSEPGHWLKTPLASAVGKGRVTYKGKSIEVQLIPIEGESSAGSRMSMQAMLALGIHLTELVEVQVSAI